MGLPSVNRLAVKSVAIEVWKSLGPSGRANVSPLTSLFGQPISSNTRAGDSGIRNPATRFPMRTFIDVATTLWNGNQLLRSAPSIVAAKRVASFIAEACPLWSSYSHGWFSHINFAHWTFVYFCFCSCDDYHPLVVYLGTQTFYPLILRAFNKRFTHSHLYWCRWVLPKVTAETWANVIVH